MSSKTNGEPAALAAFVKKMQAMDDDPLADSGSKMVIYRGNPTAKLMIVGEAPGTQENKQGAPFVGPSGKLLEQILNSVAFTSEKDVFITNAVFRMPPGTGDRPIRKPTNAEIDYYQPYLKELIEIIDPQIILLTGGVSMRSVLNETKQGITKMRGQWFEVDGRWVMPIFHPAYLLRNPSKEAGSPKAFMWQDIQEVRKKYDEVIEQN